MIYDQFKEIYNKNQYIRQKLLIVINSVLSSVDFSNVKLYKIDSNPETKTNRIYVNLFGTWRWSWMNSINTNYSCLYILIDEINKTEQRKILSSDLINKTDETIEYFSNILLKNKQNYFTPGSTVFRKMFFMTQNTWNKGLISVISGLITISKHFDIDIYNVEYHRGTQEDMSRGCDLKIFLDGKSHNTQHKIANLYDKGGYFTSNNFIYNENTYRENLDLISIESNGKIYLFSNSKDKNLCGTDDRGYFKIYKTLLIKIMHKEKEDISNLLMELTKVCGKKEIIFEFEKGHGKENYFEDKTNDKIKSLRLFLNNLEDDNLADKIKNQIEKLK